MKVSFIKTFMKEKFCKKDIVFLYPSIFLYFYNSPGGKKLVKN